MGRLDAIAQALTGLDETTAAEAEQVAAHFARLTDQVTQLQATIDGLTAGAVDQADIDALSAQAAALTTSIDAIDTEGDAPPA